MTRRTPREAVAEKERVCCGFWSNDEAAEAMGVGVEVGSREKVCDGWKRVGVERREEKGLEERFDWILGAFCVRGLTLEGWIAG